VSYVLALGKERAADLAYCSVGLIIAFSLSCEKNMSTAGTSRCLIHLPRDTVTTASVCLVCIE